MRRREVITLLGGGAAASSVSWPLAARAQQSAMPVIGYLAAGSPGAMGSALAAFRKGLSEMGYAEGSNVAIEYHYAQNDRERLPEVAANLVRRRPAVIAVPNSTQAALAAKALTTTIPIIFGAGGDPVQFGLVASLNRPGGNATGITDMGWELAPKRLGLMRELLPRATRIAVLVNPTAVLGESMVTDLQTAAATVGLQIDVVSASTDREINSAFAAIVQKRADAVLVNPNTLFANRRIHLVSLAMRHAIPAMYFQREAAEAGGLMSYAANSADQNRQVGIYTGRILKGERPADLPVLRPTKFELVINLQTARLIGVEVPPTLLATADEVIE